jgi:hypothetical protein
MATANPCRREPPGAKPSLSGLVKIQLLYQSNATPTAKAANVLHVRWSDNVNHLLPDLSALATYIGGQWETGPFQMTSAAWFHIATICSSLGGDGTEASVVSNFAGGAPGVPFPPQCAVCITWKSGIVARGGRARTYLPGIPQSAVTTPNNAALTSTFSSSLETLSTTFMNNVNSHTIGGATPQLGVPSYYSKCALRGQPIWYPFYAVNVHQRLDSQRRRSGKESTFPIT